MSTGSKARWRYPVTVISISDAKKRLSSLVARAAAGERISIGAFGQPQVELISARHGGRGGMTLGGLRGKLTVPVDFDAPLSAEDLSECDDAAL